MVAGKIPDGFDYTIMSSGSTEKTHYSLVVPEELKLPLKTLSELKINTEVADPERTQRDEEYFSGDQLRAGV